MQAPTLQEDLDSARREVEVREREFAAAQSHLRQAQERYGKILRQIAEPYLQKPTR